MFGNAIIDDGKIIIHMRHIKEIVDWCGYTWFVENDFEIVVS